MVPDWVESSCTYSLIGGHLKSLILFVGFVLCSQTLLADYDIEKIIGNNDLVSVEADASNIPFKYRKLVNAFGKMNIGCTATHLGQGYVITAGHCVDVTEGLIKNQECSIDYDVEWGFRGDAKPYMYSKCQKVIIAERNFNTDYALIKVYPVPPFSVGIDLEKIPEQSTITTIFSHPEEGPLAWSKTCRIKKTQAPYISNELIHHVCDTNPGSSGAAIISTSTLKIVGIHSGGFAMDGVGFNYGSYVMKTQLPEILKQLGL